jgi:hypothetical protein
MSNIRVRIPRDKHAHKWPFIQHVQGLSKTRKDTCGQFCVSLTAKTGVRVPKSRHLGLAGFPEKSSDEISTKYLGASPSDTARPAPLRATRPAQQRKANLPGTRDGVKVGAAASINRYRRTLMTAPPYEEIERVAHQMRCSSAMTFRTRSRFARWSA